MRKKGELLNRFEAGFALSIGLTILAIWSLGNRIHTGFTAASTSGLQDLTGPGYTMLLVLAASMLETRVTWFGIFPQPMMTT